MRRAGRLAALPADHPAGEPADLQRLADGDLGQRGHRRGDRADRARRGRPRRGARPLRRHPRPAVPAAAPPGGDLGAAGRAGRGHRRGRAALGGGAALRPVRTRRPALPGRRVRRRGAVRAGRPRRPTGDLVSYGAVPPAGAVLRIDALPHRRRPGRQRGARPGPGAEDQRAVRRPGREPGAGHRRRRGRDADRRQGPRSAAAALPRPGGHRRGLRAAGPGRRARRRPGALRGRGAPSRPASGCWSCRTWPPTTLGRIAARRPQPVGGTLERITQQPGRAAAGRHPAAGAAARLRLADRGGQPEGPAAVRRRPRCGPRCCGRSTGSTTRCTAAPTARAGRSAGRSRPTRCTRRWPGSRASTWPGRSRCSSSRPSRTPASAARAVQRLDLPPTALVYSFEHQVRVSR